jgi:uncharacterized membrane protein
MACMVSAWAMIAAGMAIAAAMMSGAMTQHPTLAMIWRGVMPSA